MISVDPEMTISSATNEAFVKEDEQSSYEPVEEKKVKFQIHDYTEGETSTDDTDNGDFQFTFAPLQSKEGMEHDEDIFDEPKTFK